MPDAHNLDRDNTERLNDFMGQASGGAFRKYLATRASTPLRYILEQGAQWTLGWIPGPPGMIARMFVYRALLRVGSSTPIVESGSEFLHMDNIVLGKSVYIDRQCRLHASRAGIELGDCTRVMRGAYVCSFVSNARPGEGIATGRRCWIGVNAVLASGQGGLFLGDDVLIGPQAVLVTGDHDYTRTDIPATERSYTGRPIRVGSNVWIGTGATVLGGVSVGDNAVIAAGAVVTRDVPEGTLVGGVPGKILKNF